MKRLSRILVPVQSTYKGRYGQDPYGYTPQGSVIPVLYDLSELARFSSDCPERWMLETQLRLARNMVVDALEDAARLIDDCARQLE